MEGVRIVLQDNARPRTRTAVAVALVTFVSGATFALSTATATDPGPTPRHAVDAQTTYTAKQSVGQRTVVTRQSQPINAMPDMSTDKPTNKPTNKPTKQPTSVSAEKTGAALASFTNLSRREMTEALKKASVKGKIPSRTALANFTAAMRTAESGGRYSIRPQRGSTISGAYQAASMTWDNYRGYRYAYQAPRQVQDAWAFRRFITLWQIYRGDWERVAAHHFLPAYADEDKALWRQPLPLRFRAGNPPTIREYVRRVYTHLQNPS